MVAGFEDLVSGEASSGFLFNEPAAWDRPPPAAAGAAVALLEI
jgi:hypothetical protein